MKRSVHTTALFGCCALVIAACQGPTLPLSAQQGSSILIPIGNIDLVDLGLVGYGGTLQQDRQRGQINYFLDAPTGMPLSTRATSIVQASQQSPLGRGSFVGSAAPYMVVSLVDIPANAPLGDHVLYASRKRGSEPAEQIPYQGHIKILPSPEPISAVGGLTSAFIGAPFAPGDPFESLAFAAPSMLPDPTLMIAFDQPLHAVRLSVSVPSAKVDVLDAVDPVQRGRSTAHRALVWIDPVSAGTFIVNAIAATDALPIDTLALVFRLKPAAAPLTPEEVAAVVSLAADESGATLLPVNTATWIE